MRILHVITSLKTGGAEKLMVDLLPLLNNDGNTAHLAVFDGNDTPFMQILEQQGVKVHKLSKSGNVYNPVNILRLRKLMPDYDIVHAHNTAAQAYTAIASATLHNAPILVTTEHNTTNRRRGNALLRLADKYIYGKYAAVVAITDQVEQTLSEHLGKHTPHTTVIPNGIDTTLFTQIPPKTRGKIVEIVMVGAFRAQKDQPTLIRAMQLLPDNFRLRLAGRGDLESDCKALVKTLRLNNKVIFEGVRTDIPNLYASADYIAMSTHYEGLPLSVLEAMCSGRPIVASDVPGVQALTQNCALLFPDGDEYALAQSILRLEKSPELKAQLTANARERGSRYSITTMAHNYTKLYKALHPCTLESTLK